MGATDKKKRSASRSGFKSRFLARRAKLGKKLGVCAFGESLKSSRKCGPSTGVPEKGQHRARGRRFSGGKPEFENEENHPAPMPAPMLPTLGCCDRLQTVWFSRAPPGVQGILSATPQPQRHTPEKISSSSNITTAYYCSTEYQQRQQQQQ